MILGHTAVALVWSTDINYISPGAVLNTLSPHKQATIFTSSEKNILTDMFIITDRISEIGITAGILVFLKTTTSQFLSAHLYYTPMLMFQKKLLLPTSG
jgi:hypothetical protein